MAARWVRRAWEAPVFAHGLALLAVLIALAVVVGTGASFLSDEGAAVVQARHLADEGSWIVDHPLPELDATNRFYPYELSEAGERGVAPFAKHPAYSLALAGLWWLGGINALVGLSIVGTVVASLIAAAFARRIAPDLARPTLWALGLGSPLLFDSYLVIAHTVGAALAGALVFVLTRRSGRTRPVVIGGSAGLAAALVLVRTEGVFLIAAAAAVMFFVRRARWVAVAAGVAGALAFFGERLWTRSIVGAAVAPLRSSLEHASAGGGGFRGRLNGAMTTLFRPSYSAPVRDDALLLLALVCLAAAVVFAWQRSQFAAPIAAVAAAAVLMRLIDPPLAVPGLFVACPVLWSGGWALATMRPALRMSRHLLILGVFVFAVLATQYERGGGFEWGGRYFAIALPVAIPIAVGALRTLPRGVVIGVTVAAFGLSVLAIAELRSTHRDTASLFAAIDAHPDEIAITTAGLLPRLDWPGVSRRQWLLVPPADVDAVLKQLPGVDVHHVIVVYPNAVPPEGWRDRGEPVPGHPWRIESIALDPSP